MPPGRGLSGGFSLGWAASALWGPHGRGRCPEPPPCLGFDLRHGRKRAAAALKPLLHGRTQLFDRVAHQVAPLLPFPHGILRDIGRGRILSGRDRGMNGVDQVRGESDRDPAGGGYLLPPDPGMPCRTRKGCDPPPFNTLIRRWKKANLREPRGGICVGMCVTSLQNSYT